MDTSAWRHLEREHHHAGLVYWPCQVTPKTRAAHFLLVVETNQIDLLSINTTHTLIVSGGSGRKVFMNTNKVQTFSHEGSGGLDRIINEWLAALPQEVQVISLTKYCAGDGRKHYCSVLYRSPEISSPSKK
jgi:hypothetical protein